MFPGLDLKNIGRYPAQRMRHDGAFRLLGWICPININAYISPARTCHSGMLGSPTAVVLEHGPYAFDFRIKVVLEHSP